MKKYFIVNLLIIGLIFSCQNKEIGITVMDLNTVDNLRKFQELNLDSTHQNLLTQRTSTREEQQLVFASWKYFHQQIANILQKENFTWESEDKSIKLLNKIYFTKQGKVKNYFFKVINESISDNKIKEFEKLILDNIGGIELNIQREHQFAQCGKIQYPNL